MGRVWYHKLGLNWTNHDRMPALRSLCCVFVLAKYRGISKTRFFRWKRKVFTESKPCRENRYKAQATEASKSLQRVQTVSWETLQSSIHSVKRYQLVSQTISRFHKNETTCGQYGRQWSKTWPLNQGGTYHRLSRLPHFFWLTKITIGLAGLRLFFRLRKFMELVSMNVGGFWTKLNALVDPSCFE